MNIVEIIRAFILGIVEGITEWLPISSTGHMILVNSFLQNNDSFTSNELFIYVIQFGAILAVVTMFFKKLNPFSPSKSKYIVNYIDGVTYGSSTSRAHLYLNYKFLAEAIIPDDVTYIKNEEAFSRRKCLTKVIIGNGITSIDENTFYNCANLVSVNIGNNATSIGKDAFSYCDSLTNVNISDSVTSIGDGAFLDCYNLKSITIPDSVTSIGNCAFFECEKLSSVTIGNGVTSIGDSAFFRCHALTNLVIGDSVNSIGEDAFTDWSNLTRITISDSVTTIDDYAFYRCYRLKDVYYTGTKQEWAKISIGSYNDYITNATIHYNWVTE